VNSLTGEPPCICYGPIEGEEATFVRVCPHCGRFVKADIEIAFHLGTGQPKAGPNATCSRCGRVEMEFEGYYGTGGPA